MNFGGPTYPLKGTFAAYMRRDKASTLLFSMARQLTLLEEAGLSIEQVFTYLSEGDYVGIALVQDPAQPLEGA